MPGGGMTVSPETSARRFFLRSQVYTWVLSHLRTSTMKILLNELAKPQGSHWQVQMDQHVVTFRSEAEARAFIATLQARLQAPHVIARTARA